MIKNKTIKKIKRVIGLAKKQEFNFPDGTLITTKVKPKLGNKTKVVIKFSKKIDDVDFSLVIDGQPMECVNEGIGFQGPDGSNHFNATFSATKKF